MNHRPDNVPFCRTAVSLLILGFLVPASTLFGDEESKRIQGHLLTRDTGGFLLFAIEQNYPILYFLDDDKRLETPDADRIILRLNPQGRNRETIALSKEGARGAFVSPRIIRPPHVHHVTILFFDTEGDEAIATHAFMFTLELAEEFEVLHREEDAQ